MAINAICQTLFADCLFFFFFFSLACIINSGVSVEQLPVCSIAILPAFAGSVFHKLCRVSIIGGASDA